MRKLTILTLAAGVAALAACNQSPREQAADNIEANAENVADNLEEAAENSEDSLQNQADATREAGDEQADAVRNGAAPVTNNSN